MLVASADVREGAIGCLVTNSCSNLNLNRNPYSSTAMILDSANSGPALRQWSLRRTSSEAGVNAILLAAVSDVSDLFSPDL